MFPKWAEDKIEALKRIVGVVTEDDHFMEVFWGNPTADYHEFSLINILEGLKLKKSRPGRILCYFCFRIAGCNPR